MNTEQKAVMDILAELSRKTKFALESFLNGDYDKCAVRLEQVNEILLKAKSEFSNLCISQTQESPD